MFGSYFPIQINTFLKWDLLLLFSHSVVSDSARLPCPPSPGTCSNSCPLNWCYYLAISSSVVPFSSCLPSFPASGSFPMSWLFASGGQSIRASVSASVLPMNIQDWNWFDLLAIQGTLASSPTPQFKSINSSTLSLLYDPTLTSICGYWKKQNKTKHSFDCIGL